MVLIDADDGGKKTEVPIGVMVGQQLRKYNNTLMRNLRIHFNALVKMFIDCPVTKAILDRVLRQVEMRGVARAINDSNPVADESEINDLFMKNNIGLVSDVWSPIMDIGEKDYLFTYLTWFERFIKSTCVTLGWLMTYLMKVEKPRETIKNYEVV